MRRTTKLTLLLPLLALLAGCEREKAPPPLYEWASPLTEGQVEMMGPGTLSTGGFEMNAALGPDGREVYFSRSGGAAFGEGMTIFRSVWRDSSWSPPDTVEFSGTFVDADPFLTRGGDRIYFASKRGENGARKGDFDLWYADRTEQGWSDPVRLPEPINSREHDVSPWITDDGTLWFASRRDGGLGDYDIWYAVPMEGGFSDPVNAGPGVNTLGVEVDVCLTRDGQLLIYASHDQPVHFGSGDLYMLTRTDDGWAGPYNLGQPVNSEGMECCPSISPDGRLLLFSSTRTTGRTIAPEGGYEQEGYGAESGDARGSEGVDIEIGPKVPDTPGNGLGDLYFTELAKLIVVQEIGWRPGSR